MDALSADMGNCTVAEASSAPGVIAFSASAVPEWPLFQASSGPVFTWGERSSGHMVLWELKRIYDEAVHWYPNVFTLPLGDTGKRFVSETTRLLQGFAEGSALELVSSWALLLMPQLLLQKPSVLSSHR